MHYTQKRNLTCHWREMPKKKLDSVETSEPVPVETVIKEYKFTKDNAADNARAAQLSRTKNDVERKIVKLEATEEYRKRQDQIAKLGLTKIAGDVERDQLPEIALAIIADHGLRVLGGEWEIKTAEEATKIGKVWHDIFRLEMGEPTTISSSQESESPDQRKNRFEELKLEAKRRVEGGLRAVAGDAG